MNKKKKLLIIFIAIVLFLLVIITICTFSIYKKPNFNNEEQFLSHNLSENFKIIEDDSEITDENKYKENIIYEDVKSVNYNFLDEKKSISGKVVIDENGYLYITDDINKKVNKLANFKFKSIYYKKFQYSTVLFFIISDDLKLYMLNINNNDINTAIIKEYSLPFKITNFTNLEFTSDYYMNSSTLFVLSDNKNIFDITSTLKYDKSIKSIYNKYFVFNDNTITNIFGNILKDKNGKDYKLKYFFVTDETIIDGNYNKGLIITEDNKLIFLDDSNQTIYEYKKIVKEVRYSGGYPQVNSKLIIVFNDNSNLIYNASCTNYYCINKN